MSVCNRCNIGTRALCEGLGRVAARTDSRCKQAPGEAGRQLRLNRRQHVRRNQEV